MVNQIMATQMRKNSVPSLSISKSSIFKKINRPCDAKMKGED
jgi:hypothetical protein